MPPNTERTKDRLQKEFRTVLSLTALTATVNNQGCPILAQPCAPYRSFDEARGESHLILNAITTLIVRKLEVVAGVAYKPPPPASSALGCEPNPYKVLVSQNIDPVAYLKPEAADKAFGGASNSEAVANTDGDTYIKDDSPLLCTVVGGGKSHMARIRDESNYWERCLQIPDDDPLINHIATVEDFINLHRSLRGQRMERRMMSKQFAAYIVARCSPKMRLRVGHKSSEGFIFYLGQVNEEELRNVVAQTDGYSYVGRRNLDLMKTVTENPDLIQSYIIDHCPPTYRVSELTRLISAWKRTVDNPQQQSQGIYDGSTCVDFHRLLVATLLAYGKALDELHETRNNATMTNLIPLAQRIRYCAGMLWRLSYSGILYHHLGVLDTNEWLRLPTYRPEQVVKYQPFTTFHHREYEMNHPAVGEGGDEDGEFRHMMEASARINIAKIFRTWLRFLASHWEALSVVSHNAARSESFTHITLLAVPCYYPGPCKVAGWEPTIKALVQDRCPVLISGERIDADAVIEHLQSQITIALRTKRCHSIFHRFGSKNLSWKGTVHCEAVLASLSDFDSLPVDWVPIQRAIEGSDYTIAISTLCCPVCWELLAFLTKRPTDLTVRGRCAILSQVELPSWLPEDVMTEMLDRFKGLLLAEITTMMTKQSTKKLARKFAQQRQNIPISNGRYHSYDSLYSDGEN